MGLSNTNKNNSTFVSIIQGKFTVRLRDDDPNPDAVIRKLTKGPNEGKEVKELQFTKLDGVIVGGEMRTDTQYASMDIHIADGDEKFILQVSPESDHFSEITKRMPNIDTTEPVIFMTGFDKEANKGKGKHFLYIKQSGASVKFAFTKDEPNGLPEWEEKEQMGKKVYDKTKYNNFLYNVGLEFFGSLAPQQSPEDVAKKAEEEFNKAEQEEDIPF